MKITLYEKKTGRITANMDVPDEAVRLQTARQAGLAHVLGCWPSDRYRIERGKPVESVAVPVVYDWQVRGEAERRINSHYPIWKQMNILRSGTPDEQFAMGAYIDAVRAASNRMDPAPMDYADDKHWPSLDEPTRTL